MQPAIHYQATYVPALPNTGFEPTSTFMLALGVVLAIAALVFILPYARKTLTTIFG